MNFGLASQRSDGLESWTRFLEVRWIGILDVLPRGPGIEVLDVLLRGPMDYNFGRASQWSRI